MHSYDLYDSKKMFKVNLSDGRNLKTKNIIIIHFFLNARLHKFIQQIYHICTWILKHAVWDETIPWSKSLRCSNGMRKKGPRKNGHQKMVPWKKIPGKKVPEKIVSRKKVPEKRSPDKLFPEKNPGKVVPREKVPVKKVLKTFSPSKECQEIWRTFWGDYDLFSAKF